jgi:hypothetical protein
MMIGKGKGKLQFWEETVLVILSGVQTADDTSHPGEKITCDLPPVRLVLQHGERFEVSKCNLKHSLLNGWQL